MFNQTSNFFGIKSFFLNTCLKHIGAQHHKAAWSRAAKLHHYQGVRVEHVIIVLKNYSSRTEMKNFVFPCFLWEAHFLVANSSTRTESFPNRTPCRASRRNLTMLSRSSLVGWEGDLLLRVPSALKWSSGRGTRNQQSTARFALPKLG